MSFETSDSALVFLIDVDNTLIRNDDVKAEIGREIKELVGEKLTNRFWELYEQVRKEMDGVDIPATLKRIEPEFQDKQLYQKFYRLWMDFPYLQYIYNGAFQSLAYLRSLGKPVILSDGDASFQLRKIVQSGLARAVEGNVLIYQHKDNHFKDVETCFPAKHYVMIEDKPNLLAKGKNWFGDRITTILVKQGKYSLEKAERDPDITLPGISDLSKLARENFERDSHKKTDKT